MIGRSFKSVVWVAMIGAAALTCYMFSLRVAEERAGLAELDAQITRVEGSIRTLKTELGTRGRVQQLEHWASAEFGFTAPRASQYLDGEVTLARLELPADNEAEAPMRMAGAAPAPATRPHVVQARAPAPAAPAAVVRLVAREAPAVGADRALLRRAALVRVAAPQERPAPVAARAASPVRAAAPAPRREVRTVSLALAQTGRVLAKPAHAAPAPAAARSTQAR
jgi:hypothetical protein